MEDEHFSIATLRTHGIIQTRLDFQVFLDTDPNYEGMHATTPQCSKSEYVVKVTTNIFHYKVMKIESEENQVIEYQSTPGKGNIDSCNLLPFIPTRQKKIT